MLSFGSVFLDALRVLCTSKENDEMAGQPFRTIEGRPEGEAVEIVATSVRSVKEIQEIISRLNDVVDRDLEPDEFREAISNEVPELQKVRDILPRTRSELYAFTAILLTAMGMLVGATVWVAGDSGSIDAENIKQIVERAVEENITNLNK